jgi:osmotically inducible protein OsmC
LEREVAQAIVDTTHRETCAYSNATRRNVEVTVNVVQAGPVDSRAL